MTKKKTKEIKTPKVEPIVEPIIEHENSDQREMREYLESQ